MCTVTELLSYWLRAVARAYHQTAAFTQRKLLVGLSMGIVLRFAFWEFSKSKLRIELARDLLLFSGSYAAACLGAFVFNLFRAPVLLDRERKQEITRLSQELELPDKAQAEYLRGLLAKVKDNGKSVLRLGLFCEEMNCQQLKIEGLSNQDVTAAIRECLDLGLLRWRNDAPDRQSPISWMYDVYWIPEEFKGTLRRLLYT